MTYGWAILIIALVMIVLWQWGVFNPAGRVPESYLGFWGIVPIDTQYEANGDLTLSLQNKVIDGDVNITEINVSYAGVEYNKPIDPEDPAERIEIFSGNITKWEVDHATSGLPGGNPGMSYTMLVTITYSDNRINFTNFTSSGTIQGNMESSN